MKINTMLTAVSCSSLPPEVAFLSVVPSSVSVSTPSVSFLRLLPPGVGSSESLPSGVGFSVVFNGFAICRAISSGVTTS